MKKPIYTIPELQKYLLQKEAGHPDPKMEQEIKADDFLQTMLVGLQKQMAGNKSENIAKVLDQKKQKLWLSFAPSLTTTSTVNTIPQNFITQQLSSWGYDLQNLRIYLLLGFNCSCVIALLITVCWLNTLHDSSMLISTLDDLKGFKP